jgi:hypothetical protein
MIEFQEESLFLVVCQNHSDFILKCNQPASPQCKSNRLESFQMNYKIGLCCFKPCLSFNFLTWLMALHSYITINLILTQLN